MGSWGLGERRQVLFKTVKGAGEKSGGSGCLALQSPTKLGSTSIPPVPSKPLAVGGSSLSRDRRAVPKAAPDAWGCAELLQLTAISHLSETYEKLLQWENKKKKKRNQKPPATSLSAVQPPLPAQPAWGWNRWGGKKKKKRVVGGVGNWGKMSWHRHLPGMGRCDNGSPRFITPRLFCKVREVPAGSNPAAKRALGEGDLCPSKAVPAPRPSPAAGGIRPSPEVSPAIKTSMQTLLGRRLASLSLRSLFLRVFSEVMQISGKLEFKSQDRGGFLLETTKCGFRYCFHGANAAGYCIITTNSRQDAEECCLNYPAQRLKGKHKDRKNKQPQKLNWVSVLWFGFSRESPRLSALLLHEQESLNVK